MNLLLARATYSRWGWFGGPKPYPDEPEPPAGEPIGSVGFCPAGDFFPTYQTNVARTWTINTSAIFSECWRILFIDIPFSLSLSLSIYIKIFLAAFLWKKWHFSKLWKVFRFRDFEKRLERLPEAPETLWQRFKLLFSKCFSFCTLVSFGQGPCFGCGLGLMELERLGLS